MSPLGFRACVPVYALWMLACGSDTVETAGAGGTGGGVTVAGVLSTLTTTVGDPSPKFASDVSDYTLDVPLLTTWLEVVVTTPAGTTVTVEGAPVVNGHSARIELAAGSTKLAVVASAPGGKTTYSLEVRRGVGVVAYLKSLASHAGAECGSAIGASGNTVALGCPRDGVTAAGPERGAVFLYSLGKDGWKFDQAVAAATGADADRFGTSLALDGDTLVVGAPNRAQNQGAAYVFTRDATGTWAQVKQLKGSNSAPLDIFGSSVALAGDILAVGAPGEDGGSGGVNGPVTETAAGSGAVYVFARKDGVFTEEAYLKADAPAATDLFGSGVALFGERLAVSAPYQDTTAIDSGAVYLYERAAAVWAFTTRVKHPSPTASDAFGTSLSLGADVLAVGAPGDDAACASARDRHVSAHPRCNARARDRGRWCVPRHKYQRDPFTQWFRTRSLGRNQLAYRCNRPLLTDNRPIRRFTRFVVSASSHRRRLPWVGSLRVGWLRPNACRPHCAAQ